MRISRIGVALVSVGMAVSLVGCGGGKDDATDLPTIGGQSSGPTSSTPSSGEPPTQATPTVAPTTSTQKYGPLTFVLDLYAAPPAAAQPVLDAFNAFNRSAHKSMATNVEDPALKGVSSGAALKLIRDTVLDQKAKGVRTGGSIAVTAKVGQVQGALAALTGCYDQSKSVLVRANGTSYVGPLTKKFPQLRLTVVMTQTSGRWLVTEYRAKGGTC